MRVWIFNHYAAPPDRPAGTRHYELAIRLSAGGDDVTIFASGFSHATLREERLRGSELARTERHGQVRFIWLRTPPYRGNGVRRAANMLAFLPLALVAQASLRRPDVIVGSSVHPFAALAGLIAARLRGAAFVYEIRDLWPQTLVDMGQLSADSTTARALWHLERLLAERAEALVGHCRALTPTLRRAE